MFRAITPAKKIVTADIFMRSIRSAIMWYLATSISICNASSRRAACTASRVDVEPELDIARYHMISLLINLINITAVTIFMARVVASRKAKESILQLTEFGV